MAVWTLFTYLQGAVSNGNDTNPETSNVFDNDPMTAYHNVVHYRRETLSLDTGDTRIIGIPNSSSTDRRALIARVIGHVRLETGGTVGTTAGYGTEDHPGMIAMVTKDVTTFTLTALADDTTVEYLIAKVVDDDSSELIS